MVNFCYILKNTYYNVLKVYFLDSNETFTFVLKGNTINAIIFIH